VVKYFGYCRESDIRIPVNCTYTSILADLLVLPGAVTDI